MKYNAPEKIIFFYRLTELEIGLWLREATFVTTHSLSFDIRDPGMSQIEILL